MGAVGTSSSEMGIEEEDEVLPITSTLTNSELKDSGIGVFSEEEVD